MKTRLAFVLFLCGLLAAPGLFVAGCKKKEAKGEPVKTINVQLEAAQKRSLRPYIEAIGTLDPSEEVTISAEIEGVVREVRVSEGSAVSKGMVLAVIDDIDLSLEQKRAQAALKQVQATLANTEVEYKRKEALVKEELVTKQAFEDVATRLALADAEVDRAKAALSLANQKLAKTKLYAPLPCFVKEKRISPGDFVKNGTPLFVVIQSNPIKLHFTVPERDVGKIRVRQEVTLKVQAFPDRDFKGTVNIIYPNLEEKTRTLKVEALVPNGDGLLKPGLFAKVILYTGEAKDMVVAPITSLLYEAEKVRLFVVEGDQAKERPVKLGNKYGEVVEITEGLSEGDKVVTAGQQNLSEGARVRVQAPGQQPSGPAAAPADQAPPAKDAAKPPAKG
jgi:membrane fusion protein (multidrug efflux system)